LLCVLCVVEVWVRINGGWGGGGGGGGGRGGRDIEHKVCFDFLYKVCQTLFVLRRTERL